MSRFYAQVPTSARNAALTASALRLYLYLDERAGTKGAWYDTQTALAEALHCSTRTIRRATAELVRATLITTGARPDQVLAFFIDHRQERLGTGRDWPHPRTDMSAPPDILVRAEPIAPLSDLRSQPQRTTTRARARSSQGNTGFEHLIHRTAE